MGETAIRSAQHIDRRRHDVLRPRIPRSGRRRLPFSGYRHFSQANALLKAQPKRPINW